MTTRNAIQRVWLDGICKRHRVPMSEIAIRAEIAPSTLLRLAKHYENSGDTEPVLTMQTVEKIAGAFKEDIPANVRTTTQ